LRHGQLITQSVSEQPTHPQISMTRQRRDAAPLRISATWPVGE